MSDSSYLKDVIREYLDKGGVNLQNGEAAFFSVDLADGRIGVYASVEYAEVAPVLVGAGWHMRWPIPPVGNDRANDIIDELAGHAENLVRAAYIRPDPGPCGIVMNAGAGVSIDAIQRRCAEEWRLYFEACC